MRVPLTAERVRQLLAYDPETGELTWRITRGRTARAGGRAGSLNSEGYVCLIVDGWRVKAHRVAWLIVTGGWPKNQIDHRDEIKSNNRWTNLRDVPQSTNRLNRRSPYASKAHLPLGVHGRSSGRFMALLQINGRSKSLGTFESPDLAHAAYLAAKRAAVPGVM